jgi:hypothetical protein
VSEPSRETEQPRCPLHGVLHEVSETSWSLNISGIEIATIESVSKVAARSDPALPNSRYHGLDIQSGQGRAYEGF